MKKQIVKLSACLAILLALTPLLAVAVHAADDPLQPKMELSPTTLAAPGTVRVSINIVNTSDGGAPITVTLYDPDGKVCSGFGSGGTATIAAGASQSYSGSWTVTQKQLDAGKVIYSARYSINNEMGQPVASNRPISASIKYNSTATAQLQVDPQISPDTNVLEGQVVTLTFKLKNIGTLDISNIIIKDPGILGDKQVTYPLLKPNESTDLSYNFTADNTSKTSQAEITYSYVDASGTTKTNSRQMQNPTVINVTAPDISVRLSASKQLVSPNDKVDLTCVITNKSTLSYEQLTVTDLIQGDIESGLSIGAGKTQEIVRSITVPKTGTYKFTVKGVDSSGAAVSFESNPVTIQTTDDTSVSGTVTATPLDIGLTLEADRETVYEEPSEIVFHVTVTNFGTTTANNITVSAAGTKVTTIESLAPGETQEIYKAFHASMGGAYQFEAKVKDSTGAEQEFKSNTYQVTYVAPRATPAPTPPPTQPPTPTPDPVDAPTPESGAQFDSNQQGTGIGTILLYALAGLLVVILLAVVLLFVLDRRRSSGTTTAGGANGQSAVYDSIQRSTHRDYSRAAKRTSIAGVAKRTAKKKQEESIPSHAPDPDSYDDPDVDSAYMPLSTGSAAPKAEPYEDSVYRRPSADAGTVQPSDVAEESDTRNAEPGKESDAMETYSSDYLSRIRNPLTSNKVLPEPSDDEDVPLEDTIDLSFEPSEPTAKMSDEDAALLSGSTGQYRLSRKTPLVRPQADDNAASSRAKVEDPSEFSRRQRAQRSAQRDLSKLYEDDDDSPDQNDNAPPPSTPGRRRRR